MIRFLNLLIAILFTATAISCSRTYNDNDTSRQTNFTEAPRKKQQISLEEQALPTYTSRFISWRGAIALNTQTIFNDCKDCPASVAQILIKDRDSNQIKRCFGSLVKEDLVLTSRHCLPPSFLREKYDCKKTIQFIFSATQKHSAHTSRCLEVSDFIPEPGWAKKQMRNNPNAGILPHPDWVLLRTSESMPERVSEIQEGGIQDGQKLFLYFPSFNLMKGTSGIKKVSCESIQNSPFYPYYNNPKSPMVSIRCNEQITSGSSGSNLYNEKGQIVGTLSHGLAYIRRGSRRIFTTKKGLRFSPWAAINNISCILNIAPEDKKNCQFNPKHKKSFRRKIFITKIRAAAKQAEKAFSQWSRSVNLPIEWEKLNTEELNEAPQEYQDIFIENQNKRKAWLDESGNTAMTKLFLPAYPKCIKKDVHLPTVPFPIGTIKIIRTPLRRIKVEVSFSSSTGVLFQKNSGQWIYRLKNKYKGARYNGSTSDYFSPGPSPLPRTQLSLCK